VQHGHDPETGDHDRPKFPVTLPGTGGTEASGPLVTNAVAPGGEAGRLRGVLAARRIAAALPGQSLGCSEGAHRSAPSSRLCPLPNIGIGADRPPLGASATVSSRSAARAGATSPGVRRSGPGTLAGGRQLNARPLGSGTDSIARRSPFPFSILNTCGAVTLPETAARTPLGCGESGGGAWVGLEPLGRWERGSLFGPSFLERPVSAASRATRS
jgi:hypothetical protein